MTVRKARGDDLPALGTIEASAAQLFRGTAMEFAIDDPPLGRDILEAALAGETLWIADQRKARAGFLCGRALGDELYIEELAVAAEFQGFGLGRALMESCIAEARERFAGVSLTTDRELPWNGPFYATLGFVDYADPPPAIAAKLEEEIAAGFDPDRRCAMVLRFG
ncbi:MAG: GNAT family N-acetyltransferase [Pseudomonadota bacterium]